jgi:hypothetical protein
MIPGIARYTSASARRSRPSTRSCSLTVDGLGAMLEATRIISRPDISRQISANAAEQRRKMQPDKAREKAELELSAAP